jgi:hypothetical protein
MALHAHNIHFGMGGALMAGGAEEGLKLAEWFLATYPEIPADNMWRQAMANNAYALYGRFGSDEQVAALAEPAESHPHAADQPARIARGEAAARAGTPQAVEHQAAEPSPASAHRPAAQCRTARGSPSLQRSLPEGA